MRIPPTLSHARPDLPEAPPPPGVDAIAAAFAALARLRREVASALPEPAPGLAYDPERFAAGRPLLADRRPADFEAAFGQAALLLLPRLGDIFPALAREAAMLGQALAQGPRLAGLLAGLLWDGAAKETADLAMDLGLSPAALAFLGREVLATVLRREAAALAPLADDALWKKPCCPICGALADMGLLQEKSEASEFLVAKAGRLSLHCSLCGHLWHFPRLVCPSCGESDHEKLDLLIPAGRDRERIHACATCGRYLIVRNRVESELDLDPDAAPAGLVHLDAAAQAKGYAPLCPAPWNQLKAEE